MIKRGYDGNTKEGFLGGDLWEGTNITKILREFNISKNCFGIVKAKAVRNFSKIKGFINFFGLSGQAKSCISLKSEFFLLVH